MINGEAKRDNRGAVGKPNVRNAQARGTRCARLESLVVDPKPDDLCLSRLKPGENRVEGSTGSDVQIVRMTWV